LGVLELTALPSINEEDWVPMVRETDVLLVNGGDPLYLCYWMRQSGLADDRGSNRAHCAKSFFGPCSCPGIWILRQTSLEVGRSFCLPLQPL
jgi:hypothetical protein